MFTINYYADAQGNKPVETFIDNLDAKTKTKVFGHLELLETYGNQLGMPFSKYLMDGIFELRITQKGMTIRIFYFFSGNAEIILTHGFKKKSQKTPRREIEKATRLRKDWMTRNERL